MLYYLAMTDLTVVIKPGERTKIHYLPFTGKGAGYSTLGGMFGATRRGQVGYEDGVWSVSPAHTDKVVFGLAKLYGRVRVIQHGGLEKCVQQCWEKGNPEKALECQCSCAGRNHGSGHSYDYTVGGDGPGGELSVQASAPREFYVSR